jgi:hypothetical protein
MNIILLFFCLQAFCLAAGFGVADFLLKKTSYRHLAVLLGPILFPVCLILLLTMGGYGIPQDLPPALPLLLAIPFLVYTIVVIYRDRERLILERAGYWAAFGVLAASTALALIAVAPDIANQSLTYIGSQLNAELLNYAALASHLMGRTIHTAYQAAYQQSASRRNGADLLLAALASALRAPPANCVSFLIALFRAHTLAAFAFLLLRATDLKIFQRPWLLYSGLTLFALSSVELMNDSVSFLSHYGVVPVVILIVAFLQFKEDVSDARILAALTFFYLYLYISYSECVPVVLFIQGIEVLVLFLQTKSAKLALLASSPPIAAALFNPLLLTRRLRYLALLANAKPGFVMLGTPRDSVLGYFATVLGLRFPFLSVRLFDQSAIEAALVAFFLLSLVLAFWIAMRYQRRYWLLSGGLLFCAATALAWSSNPAVDGPSIVYKANKALVYGNFVLVATFILAVCDDRIGKWSRRVLTAGYVAFLSVNFLLGAEVVSRFVAWPKAYPLTSVAAALRSIPYGSSVVLPSDDLVSSTYWNGVLQFYGVRNRFIDFSAPSKVGLFDGQPANGDLQALESANIRKGIVISDAPTLSPDKAETVAREAQSHASTLLYRSGSFCFYFGVPPRTLTQFRGVIRVRSSEFERSQNLWPILTMGRREQGVAMYLRPSNSGGYFVVLDVWGRSNEESKEVPAGGDVKTEDTLVVDGALSNNLWTVGVSVNGNSILRYQGPYMTVRADLVFFGENRISFPNVQRACPQCTVDEIILNGERVP